MNRACAGILAGLCVVAAAQQQPQPQAEQRPEPPPLKVQVNEVIVPVTVTDVKNRFISNLEQSDFQIFEDGKEQSIKFFSRDRNQPVVVGFVLDLSASARIHWNHYKESAKELAWILLAADKQEKYSGFLVTYSTDAELAINTTTDPGKITDRIDKLKTGGGAAMFDAIQMAITKHKQIQGEPIEPRRVLVVVGSGNDNASKSTIEQTIELAQRHLVTIYGVSTTAYGFANTEGDANLTRLAEETGGRVEYPLQGVYSNVDGYLSKPQDAGNYSMTVESGGYAAAIATNMFNAIANVAGEVTTQYILRYVPQDVDEQRRFHNIKVVVKVPDAKVRARRGYYQ